MSDNLIIIYASYNINNVLNYESQYQSTIPNFVGTSAYQTYAFTDLYYGTSDIKYADINWISNKRTISTYLAISNIIETIVITLLNGSSIFANYTYNTTTNMYPANEKIIAIIYNCTGELYGKKGFIEIDVINNLRFLTIILE